MTSISRCAITALLFSSPALFAEEWPKLVELDDGGVMYVRPGSAALQQDAHGSAVFSVDAKLVRGKEISLMEIQVAAEDCIKEKGMLRAKEVGTGADGDMPFLFGSGTGASVAAETLCNGALQGLKNGAMQSN